MVSQGRGHGVTSITFNLLIFFASVYLMTSSGGSAYTVDTGRVRYEVTRSIVERADLAIPAGLGVTGTDGRDYSWFGLGQSVLAVPFYLVAKYAGADPLQAVSIINQLFGAATAVLLFLFSSALGYSRRASLTVALFYGLGTIAWHYAKSPGDHVIETFFVLLCVYFMYCHTTREKPSYLHLSAISLGIAFMTRPYAFLVMPPLALMPLISLSQKHGFVRGLKQAGRDAMFFSLTILPFAALALWYNFYRFGSVFETGYGLIAERTGLDFFAGTPLLTGLIGFLASPGKGFFYYSPVAVLFFFSVRGFSRKFPGLAAAFVTIAISYLIFLAKNIYWHGDFAWGPRYLLVLTPFLILPVAELLDSPAWHRWPALRRGVHVLFAVSLAIQLASVSVDICKYFVFLQTEKGIQFTTARGPGVQPICEPPVATYFDWRLAPIPAQFRFMYEIAWQATSYRFSPPPQEAPPLVKLAASPYFHLFDFWWYYEYSVSGNYAGLLMAGLLAILAIFSATRLKKNVGNFRNTCRKNSLGGLGRGD